MQASVQHNWSRVPTPEGEGVNELCTPTDNSSSGRKIKKNGTGEEHIRGRGMGLSFMRVMMENQGNSR